MLFGAIADVANEKLASEMPDLFIVASECVQPLSLNFLLCVCIKVGLSLSICLYIRNGTQRRWIQEVFGSRPAEHDPPDN